LLDVLDQLTPNIGELTRALEEEVEKRAVTRRLMTQSASVRLQHNGNDGWRKILISLIYNEKGEGKAHTCANASLEKSRNSLQTGVWNRVSFHA